MKSKKRNAVIAIAVLIIAVLICLTVYLVKNVKSSKITFVYPDPNDIPTEKRTPEIQEKIDRYNELGKRVSKLNLNLIQRRCVEKSYEARYPKSSFLSNWVVDCFSSASIRCIGNFRRNMIFIFTGETVTESMTELTIGSKTFTFGHSISVLIYDKTNSRIDNYGPDINLTKALSDALSDSEIAECADNLSDFLKYCAVARYLYEQVIKDENQTSDVPYPVYDESTADTADFATG